MNKISCYNQTKLFGLLFCLFALTALSGCLQDDSNLITDKQTVAIPIEISSGLVSRLSIEEQPHTVNRALILPFKKTDENITNNDDSNFELDALHVKQLDIDSDVSHTDMLQLTLGSTYKVIVIGLNRNDGNLYDASMPQKFTLEHATLANLHIMLTLPADVPELFIGVCQSYSETSPIGEYFKPEQVNSLEATITRLSSGLNMEITNIPDFITSITLVAETLVKGVNPFSGAATAVELPTAADSLKTFSTQAPASGNVSFNHFLLPTFDINKTLLYLDIKYGTTTERYTVTVPDSVNISSGNRIIFSPNGVVKISGDYSKIDMGFTIEPNTINLDDDIWDGLQ